MEQKERYEWNSRFDEAIKDNQTGDIVNAVEVLNKQDKQIKELEEMQKVYKEISYNETLQTFELNNIKSENQKLKQQLHDLPKKIVSEIKDCLLDFSNGWWRYFVTDGCEYMLSSDLQGCLDETIDTILKKYGGEDEQNNRKS